MRRGTTTIASAFSLRAPIAGEEERVVFERRLSFTLALVATLAFGFWLIQLASAMIVAPAHVVHLFTKPTSQIHLGIVAATYLIALAVRRMKLSSLHRRTREAFVDVAAALADQFSEPTRGQRAGKVPPQLPDQLHDEDISDDIPAFLQ